MTDQRAPVVDAGLQAERTRLSWARTALSFAGMGALMLHIGNQSGGLLRELPGVAVLGAAAVIYLLGVRRYSHTPARVRSRRPVAAAGPVAAVAALASFTAALALLLITTG